MGDFKFLEKYNMDDFKFSYGYVQKLASLKSREFQETLFSKLSAVNRYLKTFASEDTYKHVYAAIEVLAPIVKEGNIVVSEGIESLGVGWETIQQYMERSDGGYVVVVPNLSGYK